MTLSPAAKITEKLRLANQQNIHGKAIAELVAKADAEEAKGHQDRHLVLRKRIYDALVEVMPGEVEWTDSYFHRSEVTIEDYTDYSADRTEEQRARGEYPTIQKPSMHFGWRGGDFKFVGRMLEGFYPMIYYKDTYEQHSSGFFRRDGKFLGTRIYIGNYGNYGDKIQFKQMKGGIHRYADIAQLIKTRAESHKMKLKAATQAARNKTHVEQVLISLDAEFKTYNGVQVSSSANKDAPVTIRITTTRTFTEEQAIELLNMLKKFNLG